MNAMAEVEQTLLAKLRVLSAPQVAEVQDFVEFLAAKSARRSALERILSVAPAIELANARANGQAGARALGEEQRCAQVESEIRAVRAARTDSGNTAR